MRLSYQEESFQRPAASGHHGHGDGSISEAMYGPPADLQRIGLLAQKKLFQEFCAVAKADQKRKPGEKLLRQSTLKEFSLHWGCHNDWGCQTGVYGQCLML